MAAKKTTKKTNKSKKPQFKEFKYSGKIFEYSGRIYSGREGSGKIQRRWPLSLCLNNVFTLKGVWLTQTKNNVFFRFRPGTMKIMKNGRAMYFFPKI